MFRTTHSRMFARVGLSAVALFSAGALTLATAGAGVAGAAPSSRERHAHHSHRAHDAHGTSGVVTAVSPTLLTITDDGQSASFTLTASTAFVVNGVTIPPSAVVLGSKVRVTTSSSSATTPPTASVVELERAPNAALTQSVDGVVSSISPTQIVITHDGQTLTFAVVATTNVVTKAGAATIGAVIVGAHVRIVSLATSPSTAGAVFVFTSESSHAHGVNGVVSSISPTQIVITHDSQTLTFALDASTTYAMINGASATLANVTTGSRVRIVASATSASTAGEIFVFANASAPRPVDGVVSSVSPTQIVITHDSQTLAFALDASTTYAMKGGAATIANVAAGAEVRIIPSPTSPTTAALVIISAGESSHATSVRGIVTAVSASSISVASHSGLVTFVVNATTVFMKDHVIIVPGDVTVGARVCVVSSAATSVPLTAGLIKLLSH